MKKNNIFSKFKLIFFKKNNYIFTKVFDILGKKQIYFSIILISFLGIIASIISSLTPLLLQDVINKLEVLLKESDEDKKLFHDFFLSFFVILSLSIIKFLFCDVPGMILVCYIDQTNGFKLRKKMVEKISKLPFSYFSKVSQGKFFSLFIHDIYIISSSFIGAIANIWAAGVLLIGTVTVMMIINPIMGGLCLITIPAIIFVVNYITRKTKKISETRNKDYDLVNQNINEMFSNTLLIRMNNKEKEAQIEFDKLAYKLHTSTKKATFVSALQNAFININQYVNITIICIYALLMSIISNNTSAAYSIPSFLILISCAQIPYTSFSININGLASSINSLERCLKLLEEKECENDENKKTYDLDNIESIEFKNVDFSYNNETKTINNISISIKKNQKIALVGQTGCGKTTLINLLMHFYDVSEGEILINGININDIKSSQLRNLFSLISQEPWFFYGTIKDNIVYNIPNVSLEKIKEVCVKANIYDYIESLPNGFETIVSALPNISIGQKQLLIIARMMLKDSKIVILDEATSNIDTETERKIQNSIELITKNKTVVTIAHRLSTIRNCDKIFFLEQGKVVEEGTHEQLLSKNGEYANLYKEQFK